VNRWDCDEPGCKSSCVGTGGAIGLRAIGWYFVPGMRNNCYCPRHRPDRASKPIGEPDPHDGWVGMHGPDAPYPCSMCSADREADYLQRHIPALLESAPWLVTTT
jgi:hypothetical protein